MTDVNEVKISPDSLKEFREDMDKLVNMATIDKAASDDLGERAKELQEKYSQSETLGMKAGQYKKMAQMIAKDNVEEERGKALEVFELLEHIKG